MYVSIKSYLTHYYLPSMGIKLYLNNLTKSIGLNLKDKSSQFFYGKGVKFYVVCLIFFFKML